VSGGPRRGRAWRPADAAISADPYATLGLPGGASIGEVKRAYRRLAKAFHPDSAGAEALPRFLAIHEAYERIATGRVLPGTAGTASTTPPREPWRADPARARATREGSPAGGASARARARTRGRPSETASGAGSGSSRRHATRKATLGSTTYDDARERADATWSGASWYGPTTGEYWIINPREYADPRKHGPAYQARVRQETAGAEDRGAQGRAADDSRGRESEASAAGTPAGSPRAAPGARSSRSSTERPAAPRPERPIHPTASTAFARAPHDTEAVPDAGAWARWPSLGGSADDPIRRLRLALVAWPPLGVAAAIAAGDVTGCSVYAASCTGAAPLLPWLAQVVILALLMLLPPLARLLAIGTVGVLLALVPVTAVLLAVGGGGAPQAGFALGTLLALAWLAGVAYAAVSAARRGPVSSP